MSTAAPRVGMREIPAPPVERHKLRRLLPYFRPYTWRALTTVVLMLVVTACGLAVPALAQYAIDHGITARDKGVLVLSVVVFVVIGLVGWLAGYYQTYLSSWVGERVLLDLRTDTFRHLMRLELGYHERTPTGRTVSRLTSDIEALEQLVTDGVTSLVVNGLTFLGVVAILFTYDAELALLTFVIFPPLAIGTALFRVYSTKAYRLTRERVAEVLSTLQETLSGIRVVQGFGREEPTKKLFREVNEEYREANMSTIRLSGTYFPGVEFLSGIGTAIILYFGATRVLDQDMSIGVMVAFIGYLSSFFDPIQQLSQLYNTFQSAMAALEKIFGVLDTRPELTDAPGAQPLPRIVGDVELRDVSFGYTSTPVLQHIDLHIPAGQTVALVGTTGAGKSTLAKLVARFYDPAAGQVLIDGHDLRSVATAVAARPAVHRAPGGAPVRGQHLREPRLRHPRGQRRGDPRRRRRGGRHRVHRGAPRRLRHGHQRPRLGPLGGPAPADLVRPRPDRRPAPVDPGRGDLVGGPAHRARASRRPSGGCWRGAPPSSSPTACPPSATPTASWCWSTAASWSRAPTTSSWRPAGATRSSTRTGPPPTLEGRSRFGTIAEARPVVGDRLAVGRRVLAPVAGVRILLPQLFRSTGRSVAHSSRGLGRRPLTAVTRVQIPYALLTVGQRKPCSGRVFCCRRSATRNVRKSHGPPALAPVRPLSHRGQARDARRGGADPGVPGRAAPPPAQPPRQPTDQRRPSPHRRQPETLAS